MGLKIDVTAEGVWLLPYCKKKLAEMKDWMIAAGYKSWIKNLVFSSGERASLESYEYGLDRIRIVAGGLATHAFLNPNTATLYLLSATGALVFKSTAALNPPVQPALIGISGNGTTFILGKTRAPGWDGESVYDGWKLHLYIFKGGALYKTLTYTYPAGGNAFFVGLGGDGFVNGSSLLSYDGKRAVIPVALHTPTTTHSGSGSGYSGSGVSYISNSQGVLIFDDSLADEAVAHPNTTSAKLSYIITPETLPTTMMAMPYVATPDLSQWGWLDWRENGTDADSVFHYFDWSGAATEITAPHTNPLSATFAQNGTLVRGYTRAATDILNVGGAEYAAPTGALGSYPLTPRLVSSDASKILVGGYLFNAGSFLALSGGGLAISLDGSTYAQVDGSSVTTAIRNGVVHAVEGAHASPSSVLSADGLTLRETDYYGGNKQDTYKFQAELPGPPVVPAKYILSSTVSFAFTGTQYDNIYTKTPPSPT